MTPQLSAEESARSGRYRKDIIWHYPPEVDHRQLDMARALGGSPSVASWLMQKVYLNYGVQMQVAKSVSDDLMSTDFGESSNVMDIPWPSPCVELYFEDRTLPTIIVMRAHPRQWEEWFPSIDASRMAPCEYITAIMQERIDLGGGHLSIQMPPEMCETFLREQIAPEMNYGMFGSTLNESDNEAIWLMLHLALKVFVFASIPHVSQKTRIFRKQMHWGGKPGYLGRPRGLNSTKIEYLPRVISVRPSHQESELARDFRGRRGHIRWYHAERYVNRQGTWDFIRPVIDPHTGKYPQRVILKVRKPKETTNENPTATQS